MNKFEGESDKSLGLERSLGDGGRKEEKDQEEGEGSGNEEDLVDMESGGGGREVLSSKGAGDSVERQAFS